MSLGEIIKNKFPLQDVSLIFGYGSKVIKQNSNSTGDLFDIIIAVNDTRAWHKKNLDINNSDYSAIRLLPNRLDLICKLQDEYGAQIYFNPYVKIGSISVKYGVIKTSHLIEDLSHWNHLYVAGRLHKPIEFIVDSEAIKPALRFNKESALRAALLQLPENFDLMNLYMTITGLSYHGDLRMLFGEDKNKIFNIVEGQIERFGELYLSTLRYVFKDSVRLNESSRTFSQDLSSKTVFKNLKLLPGHLRRAVCEIHGRQARTIETDVVLSSLAKNIDPGRVVARAIATIVRRSSTTQSLKGVLTAGFMKSLQYSQRKLNKSLVSRGFGRS